MADLIAPLPIVQLFGGMRLQLEAIDATTGAPVAGVAVTDVAIYGQPIGDDGSDAPLLGGYLQPRDA